ncbi:MAG TPA: N-acylneuraminate cytidylyltransferase [Clostridiales bacterium]|nr:N-acylneuraminate cytidylyltransferase [Clostridiales bacterium]
MVNYYETVALIPARGGSKSIPLKNIKLFHGRPLIYWTLDAAVNNDLIDHVFVATDNETIKETVEQYSSDKVTVVSRSEYTATDTAPTELVMLEFSNNYNFNTMVLIQATSPLLTEYDLDKGLRLYRNGVYDSIISVVRQKRFIWEKIDDKTIKPANYDPKNRPRRQDFDGFLVENGAFYITSREKLLETKCRISGRIGYVEMVEDSYFEVDEPSDWIIIERLLDKRENLSNLASIARNIKLVAMDCDGVLTDAGMYYSEKGDELKKFNTRDGMGIQNLKRKGIKTAIITGENTELVRRRAKKLNVDDVYLGAKDKMLAIADLQKKYNLNLSEIAYIGDDINDLQVIESVGLGCCVADATDIVKKSSKYITKASGGSGAIRELAELIIKNVSKNKQIRNIE